ncbi:Pyridoxine 5'-phosphate synthase [hydrothermal vent metagenome]|uniref:Pyridoxine 5'-phosphate synthase n=1 Tax=hydrothermal vent metagenome TaxID=652676 RepID=A0A3B1DCA4_9ZZZZ
MTKLSVNINKVALLRNTRTLGIPSVVRSAEISIEAGAHGITVHPRPDQRHIRPSDVEDLAALLVTQKHIEFNIEGNPFEGDYMAIVRKVKPTQATLVPDTPEAFTSDHGWNIDQDKQRLILVIQELKDLGIRVSLFMDPDSEEIKKVKEVGADRVELYTESYARAFHADNVEDIFLQFQEASKAAEEYDLAVNAGHDLNLVNLSKFCTIPNIAEVSIGHALISDALEMGLGNAVKAYLKALV